MLKKYVFFVLKRQSRSFSADFFSFRETASAFLAEHLFGLSDEQKSLKMACLILFSFVSFKFGFFAFKSLNSRI